jgi:branched-chain amino acid transport system substrate-binding protein
MNAAQAADLVVVQVAPQKGALRTGMLAHLDHVNAIGNTVRLV